jgi:hypothetical protein
MNYLGFGDVTIVSSDLEVVDYAWNNLSRRKITDLVGGCVKRKNSAHSLKTLLRFLTLEDCGVKYNNNIIVDYDYRRYIQDYIDIGIPVIITFNWNMYFRQPKEDGVEYHAVVVNGYDDNKVSIIDSLTEYKYKLKKYNSGRYTIKWDHLLPVMGGNGDIVIPNNYSEKSW